MTAYEGQVTKVRRQLKRRVHSSRASGKRVSYLKRHGILRNPITLI